MLNKQDLLLASKMLELASDKFSNHGCNDLTKDVIECIKDEKELLKDVNSWNGHTDPSDDYLSVSWIGDSTLMRVLAEKFKKEASNE